jgi:sterol desaturase/sphingolipid hydroxylase (fatty acid hydroxylase superfamily)
MTADQPQSAAVRKRPFRVYKREQARISRHKLYPVTAFYTLYSAVMLFLAARASHPYAAIGFYVAGVPVWTFFEYLSHRYILHGRFQKSQHRYKFYKTLANKYLDPLHWVHHERPFDGDHINGRLRDLLPLFAVTAPVSFWLFPPFTASVLLAGVCQCYVIEEWVHHSVHYYNFRDPYFRYMKKHHFYHHTSQGMTRGFGLTNGLWDVVFKTQFPQAVRRRLYGKDKRPRFEQTDSAEASESRTAA